MQAQEERWGGEIGQAVLVLRLNILYSITMSKDIGREAEHLYSAHQEATQSINYFHSKLGEAAMADTVRSIGLEVDPVAPKRPWAQEFLYRAHLHNSRVLLEARSHYQQNEEDYYSTAIEEAVAAGKVINFGGVEYRPDSEQDVDDYYATQHHLKHFLESSSDSSEQAKKVASVLWEGLASSPDVTLVGERGDINLRSLEQVLASLPDYIRRLPGIGAYGLVTLSEFIQHCKEEMKPPELVEGEGGQDSPELLEETINIVRGPYSLSEITSEDYFLVREHLWEFRDQIAPHVSKIDAGRALSMLLHPQTNVPYINREELDPAELGLIIKDRQLIGFGAGPPATFNRGAVQVGSLFRFLESNNLTELYGYTPQRGAFLDELALYLSHKIESVKEK